MKNNKLKNKKTNKVKLNIFENKLTYNKKNVAPNKIKKV